MEKFCSCCHRERECVRERKREREREGEREKEVERERERVFDLVCLLRETL